MANEPKYFLIYPSKEAVDADDRSDTVRVDLDNLQEAILVEHNATSETIVFFDVEGNKLPTDLDTQISALDHLTEDQLFLIIGLDVKAGLLKHTGDEEQ